MIASAERTAREREREAGERVQAAANAIRQMRTDVADLFTRVDHQIAALESTLPGATIPEPAAAILDSHRAAGDVSEELRRYELSVLSASQRTADHLRETARAEADELLAEARAEEREIRRRIADLEAVEHRLLGSVRDNLATTPTDPAPATPHQPGSPHQPAAHQGTSPHQSAPHQPANVQHPAGGYQAPVQHSTGNGYPEDVAHREAFG